ncbi:hypothetical protein KIN20_028718 [Parelaphostrongylus tenuis]|uniref:Sorbitol dehydrogenase n=1 Tax=Parelaphostrongylus tenuis TaxID=148309 RepID=A0AAD5R199_PARTN|nr:hypothetical protein KIN20_028718 [Parelaphostrongylus tenuis]
MSNDNLSAVLYGVNDIRIEQREIPTPKANQLLIKFLDTKLRAPFVGWGSAVKGFSVGDRVALEPGIPCRGCEQCRGIILVDDACYKIGMWGSARYTEFGHVRKSYKIRLPDNISYEEGALMEPLSVAVHACRRANLQVAQRVLVEGAGPIGTLCMMVAKAAGASEVMITDVDSKRLELSKKLGADHVVCVKGMSPSDVRSAVVDHLECEPDVTIECTGAQSCMETAIRTTRSGGVVVLVGVGARRAELPIIETILREVDIKGVLRYANWSICYEIKVGD